VVFRAHDLSMILSLVGQEPTEVTAQAAITCTRRLLMSRPPFSRFRAASRPCLRVLAAPVQGAKSVVIGDRAMGSLTTGSPGAASCCSIRTGSTGARPCRFREGRGRSGCPRRGRAAEPGVPPFSRLYCDRQPTAHRMDVKACGYCGCGASERSVKGTAATAAPVRPGSRRPNP